ncbi:MAG: ADP-ribosyltransferase exoenzyme [Pseudomonadota bacterium]|jgi:hypothetical protein
MNSVLKTFGPATVTACAAVLALSSACVKKSSDATTKATITDSKGDVRQVDLSTFVAKRGECSVPGGYEIAASRNMRYSRAQFDMVGAIQFARINDDTSPLKAFKDIVTEYEQGLLIAYTGGLYSSLNPWLRETKDRIPEVDRHYTDEQWSQMALCLASGINKLAQYQGGFNRLQAYRGSRLDSAFVAGRYKKGSVITERGFQSYSFDKNVAVGYSGAGNMTEPEKKSVLFVVQGSGMVGASIEAISSFPEEKELLVNSDHKYCVSDVAEKKVADFVPDHKDKDSVVTAIYLTIGAENCGL